MSDSTFFTNEPNNSLRDRFACLIQNTADFDVLVGYFYSSGFYAIYKSLETTENIRILIGISTNSQTYEMIKKSQTYGEIRQQYSEVVQKEMEESDNKSYIEEGIEKFLEWLKSGKLKIRVYPENKIHAKIYIMTFNKNDRDTGRVITGSSNFTQNGLINNLEFNVELKDKSDYEFALTKFNELWEKSIDVSEEYVATITHKTWMRKDITPYELYLKFLYEYFKDEINGDASLEINGRPDNFKALKYQDHAVINARRIINEYNGVFLSDVVGLGKTYMGTMLCQELLGKTLVIAPPHLLDIENQGSWENAFINFGFRKRDYKCQSIGMLDEIIKNNEHKKFDTVLIDEAHRFRTEETEMYTKLAQICRGKKVILVSATPYNNSTKDLLSQIKLFQSTRKSNIPNLTDLDGFFNSLNNKLKGLDRHTDKHEYLKISKENAKIIRERVLKYLMVRRTRKEIEQYYGEDLKTQGMKFPEVVNPTPVFYEFNSEESQIFSSTVTMITEKFKYSRYTPFLYLKNKTADQQGQKNMMKFMRMLLIKRLESSFYAFQKTLDRFIFSYEHFINELQNNQTVYVSKKYTQKIFDYLEQDDFESIEKIIESGKADKYDGADFDDNFIEDLQYDLQTLKQIRDLWKTVTRDPKILAFKNKLAKDPVIKDSKLIIFTESQETARYLYENLQDIFPNQIIKFSGENSSKEREEVMNNFDDNAKNKKDTYKVLITTDILSEGTNLHRSNVIINYDIPWNPIRIMQRVGRINRVDTKFDKIYTYTFFPTDQSNDEIKLRECAEAKIQSFISLLGADAKLLTEDEEPEGHSLFSKMNSFEAIEGETEIESDLGYLQLIRKIRDEQPDLFEKIKKLPKKARSARKSLSEKFGLLTYFRKEKLQKFFWVENDEKKLSQEIDFLQTAKLLEANVSELAQSLDNQYYELLEKNSMKIEEVMEGEEYDFLSEKNNNSILHQLLLSKPIRDFSGFSPEDRDYLNKVKMQLNDDNIPKKVKQNLFNKIKNSPKILENPLKLIEILKETISDDFLSDINNNSKIDNASKKEIILSEYFY